LAEQPRRHGAGQSAEQRRAERHVGADVARLLTDLLIGGVDGCRQRPAVDAVAGLTASV
jgi:hypothetical protein